MAISYNGQLQGAVMSITDTDATGLHPSGETAKSGTAHTIAACQLRIVSPELALRQKGGEQLQIIFSDVRFNSN